MKNILEEAKEKGFIDGAYFYSAGSNLKCRVVGNHLQLCDTFKPTESLLKSRGMGVICKISINNGEFIYKWAEIFVPL